MNHFAPIHAPLRLLGALTLLFAWQTGCVGLPTAPSSVGGDLVLSGRTVTAAAETIFESDERPTLAFHFDHAYCVCEGRQNATFVLIQGDEENPTAAATIRILWRPEAGSTPIDEHASNATLHVMRFGADAAEVYSGAGFVFLNDGPDAAKVSAECWSADVVLQDAASKGKDPLGPAHASGAFTAEQDAVKVADLLLRLSRKVSAQLGYPRLVRK